jgi:hypothetical protein
VSWIAHWTASYSFRPELNWTSLVSLSCGRYRRVPFHWSFRGCGHEVPTDRTLCPWCFSSRSVLVSVLCGPGCTETLILLWRATQCLVSASFQFSFQFSFRFSSRSARIVSSAESTRFSSRFSALRLETIVAQRP